MKTSSKNTMKYSETAAAASASGQSAHDTPSPVPPSARNGSEMKATKAMSARNGHCRPSSPDATSDAVMSCARYR